MKKLIFILLGLVMITGVSCVNDTDYETPQISCEEPVLTGSAEDISEIITAWTASGQDVLTFDNDYPDYIIGYVTSNDKTGNFYKELFIQNAASEPTAAIKLRLDMRDLYTKYPVGQKVYVYLHGLAVGKYHGQMIIGEARADGSIAAIRENVVAANVLRSCDIVDITPLTLDSPAAVTDAQLGMYVSFPNMQVPLSSLGLDFVDENDSYETYRPITSCDDASEIKVETSTYADFKNASLPEGKGTAQGILTRDYGDDFYVIRLNKAADLDFQGERCDPDVLDCNNPDAGGDVEVFYEDFNSYDLHETDIPGWTNVNVNGGETLFEVRSYSGEQYMQVSAYNSGEDPLEVWLVTPAINLDNTSNEALSFRTKTGYNNGAALSVMITDNFTGDVNTTEWTQIDATLANGPASGYGEFVESGNIDISCLDGDVFVAFRYVGGENGITTTFQVDDVKVSGDNE